MTPCNHSVFRIAKFIVIPLYIFLMVPYTLYAEVSIERERQIISFCVENRVKEYIQEKIESAEILIDPFPHLVINEILPKHLYDTAIRFWPGYAHFQGTGTRQKIATTYGCIENTGMIKEKKIFWRTFGEVVVKHYIKPLISQKFIPYLEWKFPNSTEEELETIAENLTFFPYRYDSMVIDSSKYEIEPHIDGIKTFIQAIIYFPIDNEHQDLGTVLYSGSPHRKPLNEHKGSAIMEHNGDLVPVKTVAYTPNTLVAFLQSPVSWHGKNLPRIPDKNYVRRTYFLDIRLSPESMQKIYHDETPLSKYYLHDFMHLYPENW